jgi:hypothetical protein
MNIFLLIYSICTVFNKMDMDKKKFINLFDTNKDKNFILLNKWIRIMNKDHFIHICFIG